MENQDFQNQQQRTSYLHNLCIVSPYPHRSFPGDNVPRPHWDIFREPSVPILIY